VQRIKSEEAYKQAFRHIVGGVNSPSRSFKAVVGGAPGFMSKGQGAYLYDVDGHRYIDYLAAYGPVILGHGHEGIAIAVAEAAANGCVLGTPTELEVAFAVTLQEAIPSMEQTRFVNSGTEAVMTTIRVARAYTERTKIVKFAGCYHGHSDLVLVAAGSGPSTVGVPDSAGIPKSIAQDVITIPFNDPEAIAHVFEMWPTAIAAILVEPIVGNFGIVEPAQGFLEIVNNVAHEHGALVIYDEVITAFRFRYGAVQDSLGVYPDLTALGKIIGGGLPIGAYGGRRDIMEQVSPLGPAYQAGTMAGNPVSISAGIACLEALRQPGLYDRLDQLGQSLMSGLVGAAANADIPVVVNRVGGSLAVYFTSDPVTDYEGAQRSDGTLFSRFFHAMLDNGVCLAPSKYEAWFVSAAHTDMEISETVCAASRAFSRLH